MLLLFINYICILQTKNKYLLQADNTNSTFMKIRTYLSFADEDGWGQTQIN